MALFPEINTYFKGRTHTSLVISEGDAPAEKWLPASSEKVKFHYEFGPEGNQGVVIPKGKIVSAAGLEWDYETEHNVPAIKIAGDGATDKTIIGVNHHNVYERRRDRFSGNQPVVITREYIEVPLFSDKASANDIKFGAAWVTAGDNLAAANAIYGQYVTSDEHGNFRIAGANDAIVGQVLGVETDVPPAGYLQYFMEMDDERWTEFLKQSSYAPSPGREKDAAWNDIGTYPLGTGYLKNKNDLIKNFKAGIPFLTDGYFKAKTEKTYALNTAGVKYTVSGKVTVTDDKAVCTDPVGAAIFATLPLHLATDELSGITVTIDGTPVDKNNIHIDQVNDTVVIYLTQAIAGDGVVEIKATVLENQVPGIPTGWDFKGAYGAVRILLQK